MKTKKGISVIIPTYKRNQLLINCLSSILHQIKLPNEIIIINHVDDKKLKKIIQKIKKEAPVLIRYFIENRIGSSHARNRGIIEARYGTLAFIDDDCRASNIWLKNIDDFFEHSDKVVVMGRNLNGYTNSLLASYEHQASELFFSNYLYRYNHRYYSLALDTKNFAIKKSLLIKNRIFFDPAYPTAAEDVDLGFQLQKRGYKIIYEKNIITHHYGRTGIYPFIKRYFYSGVATEILTHKWGNKIFQQLLTKKQLFLYCLQKKQLVNKTKIELSKNNFSFNFILFKILKIIVSFSVNTGYIYSALIRFIGKKYEN